MSRYKKLYALFCLTLLLIIASLIITACGSETSGSQSSSVAQTSAKANIEHAIKTPTVTPTKVATVTPAKTIPPGTTVTLTATSPSPTPAASVSWTTPATMYTLSTANVRVAPSTSANIVATDAFATPVTVYGTTSGDIVNGNSIWDRISDQSSSPQYVFSGLVGATKPAPPPTAPPAPAPPVSNAPAAPISTGKVILVNLTTQHLYAYQDGALVKDFLITSGRPELMTPTGTFTVLDKGVNLTFISPWPASSPYYYAPEFVPYALRLTNTGIYIHAAPWREAGDFGPGTQDPHTLPDGTQSTGSHGCVNTTTADAAWTYNWAPIGTTVVIRY